MEYLLKYCNTQERQNFQNAQFLFVFLLYKVPPGGAVEADGQARRHGISGNFSVDRQGCDIMAAG